MDMRKIAKLAGVSSATVSRVVNGSNLVRPETVARVRKIIEDVKYYPNSSAVALKNGRSNTYGLIIPDITNPFFTELIQCFEEIVVENDREMLMATTDSHSLRTQKSIRRMLIRKVDGVALLASEIESEPFEALNQNRIPLVTMDRSSTGVGLSDVAINNKRGMDQALQHLKDLRHKKVGYIGGFVGLTTSDHRVQAFIQAMKRVGLALHPEFIKVGNYRISGGVSAMTELLSLPDRPTAVLMANDLTAIGAVRAARDLGYSIPEDVSVIGFDDIELSDVIHPPLTTLRLSRREVAETIFKALEHLKAHPQGAGEQYSVKTTLVIRQSTGPARTQAKR